MDENTEIAKQAILAFSQEDGEHHLEMDKLFHKSKSSQATLILQFILFVIFIFYYTYEFINLFEIADLRTILETELNENARLALPTLDR